MNTFRFIGFLEKISRIKIDVYHKIGDVRDLTDASSHETYLKDALMKWRELNCSRDFTKFCQDIWGLVQDLRQIIYHQDEIIEILCKYLACKNVQCLDALLDLVAQVAKDLRKEFYRHFPTIFEHLVHLLNIHNADIVEQTFTCMAYIFKFSLRYMLEEPVKIYRLYKKLLSSSQKPHIYQFAAESMSYLVRKLPNRDCFFEAIFASAEEDNSFLEGIGCLLFETIKGVNHMFHSCAKDVLQILLRKLEPSNPLHDVVYHSLCLLFKAAAKHSTQDTCYILLEGLLSETNVLTQPLEEQLEVVDVPSISKMKFYASVNCLLSLLKILIEWHAGKLVFHHWDAILKSIDKLLKLDPLLDTADALLDIIPSLLQADMPEKNKQDLHNIIEHLFLRQISVPRMQKFICSVRHCTLFETFVLKHFLAYVESRLLTKEYVLSNLSCQLLLKMLSENITEKSNTFEIPYSGTFEDYQLIDLIGTPCNNVVPEIRYRTVTEVVLEAMKQCLEQMPESADNMEFMEVSRSCVVCLPFLRPLDTNKALQSLQKSVMMWISISEFENYKHISELLILISQTIRSIFLLQTKTMRIDLNGLQYKTMFSLISRHPAHIQVLGAYECYCRIICLQSSDLLTPQRLVLIYNMLKLNLSSSISVIRLLTLRIISYYKQPIFEESDIVENQQAGLNITATCLKAEEVPASFERYLEKLMHLRKLSYRADLHSPNQAFYNDVIVRFLIGSLLVNLRPMWMPVMDIITTFADEKNIHSFWLVFSGLLRSSFNTEEQTDALEAEIQSTQNCFLMKKSDSSTKIAKTTVRLLMCKLLEKFPDVAERKSRDIVPLFFSFLSKEYEKFDASIVDSQDIRNSNMTGCTEETSVGDKKHKALSVVGNTSKSIHVPHGKKKIFTTFLRLFSQFKNPRATYMEDKLYNLYLKLLCHSDSEIQSLALCCLKSYKFPYLKPYEENFGKILQDHTFKDELTLFSSGSENGILKNEDRVNVMNILIRLLFGKLQRRSGYGVSGKKHQSIRRNILVNFMSNCAEKEVGIFVGLVTEPFRDLIGASTENFSLRLDRVIPLRKQIGYLKMLKTILKRLTNSVATFVPNLLTIVLFIVDICGLCLAQKTEIDQFCIVQLKSIRQTGLARIVDFFEIFTDIDFTVFTEDIFQCAILPQIDKVEQEAHQVTPLLKLIHCWSKFPQYQPLLDKKVSKEDDDTVLFRVFSILKNRKKSVEVIKFVMSIAENILHANKESRSIESGSQRIFAKYLNLLLGYLGDVIRPKKRAKRAKRNCRDDISQRELNVLAQISLFVRDSDQCQAIINILFPTVLSTTDEKYTANTLETIKNLLENCKTAKVPFGSLTTLFLSLKGKLARSLLCDIFEVIAQREDDLGSISDLICDMNSWDLYHVEEPDYDRRLKAFATFSQTLLNGNMSNKKIKLLLCSCIHHSLESPDISIRDASLSCLCHVINFAVHRKDLSDDLVEGLLISRIKFAMRSKNEIIRAEYIYILSMVVKNFDTSVVSDMISLTSTDPEMDFFENIRHVQVHRRIKAVRQLTLCIEEGKLGMNSLYYFLLPMVTHFISEHNATKDHNIVSETIVSMGCIAGCLTWQKYSNILRNYLKMLCKEKTKQKTILRIVIAILNAFPFNLSVLDETASPILSTHKEPKKSKLAFNIPGKDDSQIEMNFVQQTDNDHEMGEKLSEQEETKFSEIYFDKYGEEKLVLARKIHKAIATNILPLLHRSLNQKSFTEDFHRKSRNKQVDDEEILRIPLALAIVKLLLHLTKATLHDHLPGVLSRICQSLKSRARDVRDTTRATLVKIASCLGPAYVTYVLQAITAALKRGFQLHVLSYTLRAILDGLSAQLSPGDLDLCMDSILEVLIADIFHNVSDEKELVGVVGKLHEAKSNQSYDSFEIVAKFVSPRSFEYVIEAVRKFVETGQSHVIRNKIKEVFRRISLGFQKNSALSEKNLLIFVYRALTVLKPVESISEESKDESRNSQTVIEDIYLVKSEPGRSMEVVIRDRNANSDLLIEFGLQILHLSLKRLRQQILTQELLELLDPYVVVLISFFKSKYSKVVHLCTKSLALLVQFPLPSIRKNIYDIAASLFKLLNKYCRVKTGEMENRDLVRSSFKAIIVLLQDRKKCKITDDQLKILLTFIEEDIYDHAQQGIAFSLLKVILARKLNIPEIVAVMEKIGKISIVSDSQSVQLQCRQLMLQYLLDYPLGKKSENHVEFYVNQLEYEWENGRQSALEMLVLIFKNFPQKRLQDYGGFFFVPLVMKLINDDSSVCRKLTIVVLKTLLEKLHSEFRAELYDLVLNWLKQDKVPLKRLAVQVIGIFAEVEKAGFEKNLSGLLPLLCDILITQTMSMEQDDVADQLLFFALCSLKKILLSCNAITNSHVQDDLNRIWISVQNLLQHPHNWIRLASCQLFGLLFGAWTPEEVFRISRQDKSNYWVQDLSLKVRLLCVKFCEQLKDEIDNELGEQITRNLIYLTKLLNIMDRNEVNRDDSLVMQQCSTGDEMHRNTSLKWILHKMSYLASHEASQSQKSYSVRICVFRWLAAISVDLGSVRLRPVLIEILQTLHREMISPVLPDPELQNLAKEVISLIKEIVGKEVFAECYSKMQRKVTEKKEYRKRKRLEEAITDQERFALKKQRRNLAKQEQRKKKLLQKKL